ncbi:MAG: YciI family protein [Thermomicrobiales bacterium]
MLRVRDDDHLLSDGPFIESKEQLGGYYIIDVANLDEAIRWATRLPDARTGSVEIRRSSIIPVRAESNPNCGLPE